MRSYILHSVNIATHRNYYNEVTIGLNMIKRYKHKSVISVIMSNSIEKQYFLNITICTIINIM